MLFPCSGMHSTISLRKADNVFESTSRRLLSDLSVCYASRLVLKPRFESFRESWREGPLQLSRVQKTKACAGGVPFHCHSSGTRQTARNVKPSCFLYFITVWCWVPWRRMTNVCELSCVQIGLRVLTLFRQFFIVRGGSGEQVWQCWFSSLHPNTISISSMLTACQHCWLTFWSTFCSFQQGPRLLSPL